MQWDRGSRRVDVALSDASSTDVLRELAAGADVVIDAFPPGATARLNVGAHDLCREHPSLVHCTITRFGSDVDTPYSGDDDSVVAARSGRMLDFGNMYRLDRPAFVAAPLASFAAAHGALQAILAALHRRIGDGLGAQLHASLLRGLGAYDMTEWANVQLESTHPEVCKARPYNGRPRPGMYYIPARAADGRWLQFASFAPHLFWRELELLGLGHLRDDPRTLAAMSGADAAAAEELWEAVLTRVAERPSDQWLDLFVADGGAGVAEFCSVEQGMGHAQVRHNQLVVEATHPRFGTVEMLGAIAQFSETPIDLTDSFGPIATNRPHVDRDTATSPKSSSRPLHAGPLADLLVLDVGVFFALPFAAALLADLGARVIKIEALDGDPIRSAGTPWLKSMQGKESLAIDLKTSEGQDILHRLVERADVLVHNFRPGVPARLGMDAPRLQAINPRLVYVYAGAYGIDGPHSSLPGFHPTAGAICGVALRQAGAGPWQRADSRGDPDVKAQSLRLSHSNEGSPDPAAALSAATAIMLAVVARDRIGVGQVVNTSMLHGNAHLMSDLWIGYAGRDDSPMVDADLLGVNALHRLYETADGWVLISCADGDDEWRRLARVLGPELADDSMFDDERSRGVHSAELADAIGRQLLRATADAWEIRLTAAGIACVRADRANYARFLDEDEVADADGATLVIEHPTFGTMWRHAPITRFDDPYDISDRIPQIGEQTVEILSEVGLSAEDIDRLLAARSVRVD